MFEDEVAAHFRANWFQGILPESQGQILALAVGNIPSKLSGCFLFARKRCAHRHRDKVTKGTLSVVGYQVGVSLDSVPAGVLRS